MRARNGRHLKCKKKSLRIHFDFFLRLADIVCAIIVRSRWMDFNGFSEETLRAPVTRVHALHAKKKDAMDKIAI